MVEDVEVVVVGAGQAGLASSHELSARGIEHVVLEAAAPGSSWLRWWDSFTLVGPNSTVRLPGASYVGDDPDGFMTRREITDHLQAYAARQVAEIRSHTPVRRLRPAKSGGYDLETDVGPLRARTVVVATGAYQQPRVLPALSGLSPQIVVVDVATYRNPAALPEGAVLVVGSGQSACQIAEELALSGRDVVMACGRAPWFYRRLAGRDLFEWLRASDFYEERPEQLATPAARHGANVQASGTDGGHDLHYRTLAALGVRLVGHLASVSGHTAYLLDDLRQTIAAADGGFRLVSAIVEKVCATEGRPVPEIPPPVAIETSSPDQLDLRGFGAVVMACGFRSRYSEWIDVPGLVDAQGFPVHVDGESSVAPGLHFVGVHFLRRRRSSLLFGVGDDAAATAERILATR